MSNVRRHEQVTFKALVMKRRNLLVGLAALLTSCSSDDEGKEVTWASMNVATMELELIDAENYEVFGFGPQGTVSATIGLRNGPLTAPLFYWRIEESHLVISERPNSVTYADLHSPRQNGEFLVVRRGFVAKSRSQNSA
jgi:hypothetical protein